MLSFGHSCTTDATACCDSDLMSSPSLSCDNGDQPGLSDAVITQDGVRGRDVNMQMSIRITFS